MAAPSFAHPSQALRSSSISHQPPLTVSTSSPHNHNNMDRESAEGVSLLFRNLPTGITKDQVQMMVVWSDEVLSIDVLPTGQEGTATAALIKFRTSDAAREAQRILDGKQNMIVEMLNASSQAAAPNGRPDRGNNGSSATSSGNSSANSSRQPSRFNGIYPARQISPPSAVNGFSASELPALDDSAMYQNIYNPQSPIGGHLGGGPRISGKSLINNDTADDDETGELLKNPVAYAENGSFAESGSAMNQRRATAPHLPISQLSNLSINTTPTAGNGPPGPSSLPPYGHQSMIPPHHHGAMSPGMNGSANHGMQAFPMNNFHRHNYPPANPADQNPPCNTLYVGNLPIDTSEEELKALFSKCRGYKRLCFRTKQNGPMCFVEFESVTYATKALNELYGHMLHNSVKGGIRLSFSKNPLGVRTAQNSTPNAPGPMNNMTAGSANGFTTASGPPPGLSAPPGLGSGRHAPNMSNGNMSNGSQPYSPAGFPANGNAPNNAQSNPWPSYPVSMSSPSPSSAVGNGLPPYMQPHMLGR